MRQCQDTLVSVIVPVYNVEKYLVECIESILKQDVENMQVILVDDGSSDSSGTICDKYAKKDERIEVIHQKNAGVSAARNKGLDNAKGKYIIFTDSDDIVPLNSFSKLLMFHKSNELVMGAHQLMSEEGKLLTKCKFDRNKITRDEFLKDLFMEVKYPYLGYPTDKLYENEIIKKYNLYFDTRIKLNEDRLFVLQYVMHCQNVILLNDIIYYYRQRKSGVINETRRNVTVTDSEMTVMTAFEEMKKICLSYDSELYYLCVRKSFESALDLLNRVNKSDTEKVKVLKKFLWNNSKICMRNPDYTGMQRIKVLIHAILMK